MNRSFEVWFSPGAHSGAGVDQKLRVTKRYTEVLRLYQEWESGCWQPLIGVSGGRCVLFPIWEGVPDRETTTCKRSIHSGAHNDGYCESVVSLQLRGDKRWRMLGTESRVPFASIGRILWRIRSVLLLTSVIAEWGGVCFRILFSFLS